MEEDNIDKATKVINEYMTNEIFQDKKLSAQKLLAQKHTQHL